MLAKLKLYKNNTKEVAICFLFLSFIQIHYSSALSSICMFTGIGLLLISDFKKDFTFLLLLPLLVIYQVIVDLSVHHLSINKALKEISTKIPLLFLAFVSITHKQSKVWLYIVLIIGILMCWLGFASLFNYLNNKAFLDIMILESKPLPIYSKVYHIEYSLMHGLSCLLCFGFGLQNKNLQKGKWLLALSLILFLLLHILTTRTGLLSTYLGLVIIIVASFKKQISLKQIGLLSVVCFVFAISVFQIPSVKNRITNTIADVNSMQLDTNLNHKSMGQRWIAWQAASLAIQKKPLFGYGTSNVKLAVNSNYSVELNKRVKEANKVKPHTIFLELALESGIIGTMLYFLFFVLGIIKSLNTKNWLGLSLLSFLLFAGMFENILNRQAGVLVFFIAIVSISFTKTVEQNRITKSKIL